MWNGNNSGTFFMCNSSMNVTFTKDCPEKDLGIALLSLSILCITFFVGVISNVMGLQKLLQKNWRRHTTLIQLLTIALVVCAIIVPLQIARIGLLLTENDFLELCNVHLFLHLNANNCTFVTMMIITYERLKKIYRSDPHASLLTARKTAICCSWLLLLPVTIYILYIDNTMPAALSSFSYDCFSHDTYLEPGNLVEYTSIFIFTITLLAMTTMYFLAICRLYTKMSSRVGSMYPNMYDRSANVTPITVLQPREATAMHAWQRSRNSLNMFNYQSTEGRRHQSMNNIYSIPIEDTDGATSVAATNYEQVLHELRGRYVEGNRNSMDDNELTSDQFIRMRKLSDTFKTQSREKAKSSIAEALGKMSNISLFSLDSEVDQQCNLNPLKHTRRSAGNVWHETEQNQSKSIAFRPNSINKKKKKIPRKLPKLKKQNSVDSIGTFSDTSGINTDCRTDSDISSLTFNTESIIIDDISSAISVIIEQPEQETLNAFSRQPSMEIKKTNSRQNSLEMIKLNSRRPSLETKEIYLKTPLLLEPGNSCQQHDEEETIRPRSYSASFKVDDTDESPGEQNFRQRAFTTGNKMKPQNPLDKNKIRNFRRKMRRTKKNKLLSPLPSRASNFEKSGKRNRLCSSTDSYSDSCHDSPSPRRPKSTSDTTHDKIYSSSSETYEWSDSSLHGSGRISHSLMNLKSPSHTHKPKSKLVDSMTQTEDNCLSRNNSVNANEFPTILITNDTKSPGDQRSTIITKQNSWFSEPDENPGSRLHLSPVPTQSYSPLPHQLPGRGTYKAEMRQTIKRSVIIILSLALSYLPMCISTIIMHYDSVQTGATWLQVARCIQYFYFSIIPTIYVFTNQGLMRSRNRTIRL